MGKRNITIKAVTIPVLLSGRHLLLSLPLKAAWMLGIILVGFPPWKRRVSCSTFLHLEPAVLQG